MRGLVWGLAAMFTVLLVGTPAPAASVTPTGHVLFWVNANQATQTGDASAIARMHTVCADVAQMHTGFGVIAEVDPIQVSTFQRTMGAGFGTLVSGYPDFPGWPTNFVFWDRSEFTLIGTANYRSAFLWGTHMLTRVALLQDHAGVRYAVFPVHNPAFGDRVDADARAYDLALERAVSATWLSHGYRVVVAGDFNDSWTPSHYLGLGDASVGHALTVDQAFTSAGSSAYAMHATTATDHRFEFFARVA